MRSFCNCFVALLISYFTATFAIPSDCPPPREYPSLQFETCGNPRLQVQRNFNRISIWGVTPESGLVSVVATENLNRLQKWVATNFSVELELERTVGSRDGWFVACGMYDYVIHHRKSCSFCSFFRLCRVDPQPILDCSVEGTEGPQESSNLFSTRSCEDQIVSLLPDDQKETNSASLSFFISAYFDELPITEAILSVKVVKISLCVPDKVVVADREYAIYPNTFLVVNITSLEPGKIYTVHYQASTTLKIGHGHTKVHFRPATDRFRLPTMTSFCSEGLGSEPVWSQPSNNS